MNIKWKIIKPPIPIILLDTLFFIDLIKSKNSKKKSPYFDDELKLVDLIISRIIDGKLMCPFGEQRREYELRKKYKEEIIKLQIKLSFGIEVKGGYDIYQYQMMKAMEAYIKKKKEIICDYMCIFYKDPIKEFRKILNALLFVGEIDKLAESVIERERKVREEIYEDWEEFRKIFEEKRIKYEDWITKAGSLDFMKQAIEIAINKGIDKPLNEIDRFAVYRINRLLDLYNYYAKKDASIKDIFYFLESEYYASIPYNAILFKLITSIFTQEGKVKKSDYFDIKQTMHMLPFLTYFLTDSSLKHRLITKPLELDNIYGVKIYSLKEINVLKKELEKL